MGKLIEVVVVDDHLVSRKGIINLVEQKGRLRVMGEGSAGNHVLELLYEHRPDVLITDLQMPADATDPRGVLFEPVSTLQIAIREFPDTSVLVLSQEDDIQTIHSLAEVGVKGYMLKTDDFAKELDQAVEMIHRGAIYFSPEVRDVIFSSPKLKDTGDLTPRELQVLRAVARSPEASRDQLAASMHIATSTLQHHITSIFKKLEVSNMESCLLKAMRMQIIGTDTENG